MSQLLVEGIVDLHLSVDKYIRALIVDVGNYST